MTKALGFTCMNTGDGYSKQDVDLEAINELPLEELANLNIGPGNAIVRAEHANGDLWKSSQNLIWPKMSNGGDSWNKWHCNKNSSWVEVDF